MSVFFLVLLAACAVPATLYAAPAKIGMPYGPAPAGPVLSQSAAFTISGASIECIDSKSGQYATPAMLRVRTGPGSSALLEPSAALFVNAIEAEAQVAGGKCTEPPLAALLSKASLKGTLKQDIREETSRTASGVCTRALREAISLDVGGFKFEGRAAFLVGPLDQKACGLRH